MEQTVFEICNPTRCGYWLLRADLTLSPRARMAGKHKHTPALTYVLYTLDLIIGKEVLLVYFSPHTELANKWNSNRCKALKKLLSNKLNRV